MEQQPEPTDALLQDLRSVVTQMGARLSDIEAACADGFGSLEAGMRSLYYMQQTNGRKVEELILTINPNHYAVFEEGEGMTMPESLEAAFRDAPAQDLRDFALSLFLHLETMTQKNLGAVTDSILGHAIDAMLDRAKPIGGNQ